MLAPEDAAEPFVSPFADGSSEDSSSSVGDDAPLTDSIDAVWTWSMDLCWCDQRPGVRRRVRGLTRGTCLGGFAIVCAAAAEPWMNAGWFVLMYAV